MSDSHGLGRRGELIVHERPATWWLDGSWDGVQPVLALAHGAGAPATSPFLETVAQGLCARGLSVMRFHFPYMEAMARGGGRRPPDAQRVLLDCWAAVVDLVAAHTPHAPLVLAGKSMGGRMASMLLAAGRAPRARGAIYLGYPLHPPGRTEHLRSAHLAEVPVPQLFVQGTRDTLCRLDLLRPVLAPLGARARLHVVEGGDHSLATQRKDPLAGSATWLDEVARFVREVSDPVK